ncbi:Calcineurin-like phosphoesterase [Globisporangium polare]
MRWLAVVMTCCLMLAMTTMTTLTQAEMHLMDEEEVSTLDADEKSEMQKHEVENCVPYNIRSFTLGTRGVVEWSTRRTYIHKVHKEKKDASSSPWQSCSDDSYVEVRFRRIGDVGAFSRAKAITYYGARDNYTSHTAWLDLPVQQLSDVSSFEFIVGSLFHGWSSSHRIGYSGFVRTKDEELCRPKQIHTAYGKQPGSFSVQWMTHDACSYGQMQLKLEEGYHALITDRTPVVTTATTTLFTDDGKKKVQRWHHVAEVTGLKTNTRYTYVVGNPVYSWSIPYSTKTAPSNAEVQAATTPMRFLVTGDIGYQNAATLPMMQSEVAEGLVDAVVSMGDYAYDLHLANGHVGDIFMEEIEPIAAAVPFMVAPGNHETHDFFSHYTERFRLMPSNTGSVHSGNGEAPNNWFYSFNAGLVHFVFYSTEVYFKKTKESDIVARQEQWLREDLARANANRAQQPWIIVLGHRPMYCTSDRRNCGKKASFLRERLEELFYEHGVDLYICGHQHNYERAFDVYKGQSELRTRNMRATTHILTGASGQYILSVMRKSFELPAEPWDAFRNSIFGYSRLQVHNATHLHWQQVESDPENPAAQGLYGKVVDDVWLVQEHHGSFRRGQQRERARERPL